MSIMLENSRQFENTGSMLMGLRARRVLRFGGYPVVYEGEPFRPCRAAQLARTRK